MRDPQRSTPSPDVGSEPTSILLTQSQRKALEQLGIAFRDRRPVTIIIGEGRSTARSVIRHFLSRLDQDVAAVRIVGPCKNATDFMRPIIFAGGF